MYFLSVHGRRTAPRARATAARAGGDCGAHGALCGGHAASLCGALQPARRHARVRRARAAGGSPLLCGRGRGEELAERAADVLGENCVTDDR